MTLHSFRSNRGSTLVEVLMYVAIVGTLFSTGTKLFISGVRLSSYSTKAVENLGNVTELRRVFSEHVRPAYVIVEGAGDYETNDTVLILRVPPRDKSDQAPHYAVLGDLRQSGQFNVMRLAERDGNLSLEGFYTYAANVTDLHFRYETEPPTEARRVSLVVETNPRPGSKIRATRAFTATLRGHEANP